MNGPLNKVGNKVREMYPSDDNMSNFSGYSSGPDIQFRAMQMRLDGLEEELLKNSTADDTESVAQMSSSVMQGETSSATS